MGSPKNRCLVAVVFVLSLQVLSGCSTAVNSTPDIQISPTSALLVPGGKLQFVLVGSLPGSNQVPVWQVNGVSGGSASTGTIAGDGMYTAPATATAQPITISVHDQSARSTVTIFDPNHPAAGSVSPTANPLVAAYTISVPAGASVQVQFGTGTNYGLSTWSVPAPAAGGPVTVLVAGMRATMNYHMQAVVNLTGGTPYVDADHTFLTGAIPAGQFPAITTQLTGIGTPSPGIELLSLTQPSTGVQQCALATDLEGNVIWYYALPQGVFPEPIKLLPDGHMLMVLEGSGNEVDEVDLAGNLISAITPAEIEASLADVPAYQGATWEGLNHDVLPLSNGHLILLTSIQRTINDVAGVPPGTVVLGNLLIDWDPVKGAVWTWSTFDHLDLTHAPFGIADWTHGNAVIYSPDDGDIIFSMRDQNWIIKIRYTDGTGDGSVLWRFGPDGDFTLPNQEAPIEWNYGQHYPTIQSPNSSGIFSMMIFNNGNDRLVDSNDDNCATLGNCYSSVPIFQLDESAKTASVLSEIKLSPAYSICCGDALVLPNGNVEADVAYDVGTPNSYIEEFTQGQTPELVWRMDIQGSQAAGYLAYRGIRIPSLYPGQIWPASAEHDLSRAQAKR
jgi:arylsulfate sulfotransferase